jgi:hypothetical protein
MTANVSLGLRYTGIVIAALTGAASNLAFAEDKKMDIGIATMAIGAAPPNFEFLRTGQGNVGQWTVIRDELDSSGPAIEQSDQDRTDYRFPLAIYQPTSAKNLEAVVRFKAVDGKVDRAAGIAVRLKSADNYYVARANALEDNVRFYRVVNGRREQLEGANVKVTSHEWHTLGLKAEDDRFTVSFDGKVLFTATDKTFADAGKIALWTKADSVTRFDRVDLTLLD